MSLWAVSVPDVPAGNGCKTNGFRRIRTGAAAPGPSPGGRGTACGGWGAVGCSDVSRLPANPPPLSQIFSFVPEIFAKFLAKIFTIFLVFPLTKFLIFFYVNSFTALYEPKYGVENHVDTLENPGFARQKQKNTVDNSVETVNNSFIFVFPAFLC